MNIEGAIFDFDGTLFDSMKIWDTLGESYLRSLGIEPRERLNEKFKSMSLFQAAQYYRSEYGVTLSVDEIVNDVNGIIRNYYSREILPKDGIPELLELLKGRGIKMCIATATEETLIKSALSRTGLGAYFSDIFTCFSVGHGKDEPHIYEIALESLGTSKDATLVFEDALYAAKTAKAAGFYVAGIYDKYEKNQVELKNATDFYITDYYKVQDTLFAN